jgi:hypothetical protein
MAGSTVREQFITPNRLTAKYRVQSTGLVPANGPKWNPSVPALLTRRPASGPAREAATAA